MAWGDVDVKLQEELFKIRSLVGVQRQPNFKIDYETLKSIIDSYSITPYNTYDPNIHSQLCSSLAIFANGAHWEIGDCLDKNFFYRIENFDSFQRKHGFFFVKPTDNPSALFLENDNDKLSENFKLIVEEFQTTDNWINLSQIAKHFSNYREISWWTNEYDFNLSNSTPVFTTGNDLTQLNSWIIEFGYRVGFSSDWYSENILFLRLDFRKIKVSNIRVPSIIDGFCQPIFSPRDIKSQPKWGLAYDLKSSITPKYREYVIKQIPVEAIDLIPIKIDLRTIDNIISDARLTNNLVRKLITNV